MTIRARYALVLFCLALQTMQANRLHSQTQPASQPTQSDQKPSPATSSPDPNPDAAGIYHRGAGVTMPKPIHTVEPEFSQEARRRKINSTCIVEFIVETDGHVRDAHIFKSCADGLTNNKDHEAAFGLDQKAIEAVSRYEFNAGLFQGKPVPVRMKVQIRFEIF